jgi:hypothetical protein
MRGIGYDRIKRGVLVASTGAAFLLPAAAAQATPPAWAPAYGYRDNVAKTQGVHGGQAAGKITGHKIG